MSVRRNLRKMINNLGFDIHRLQKNCQPIFDPEFAMISAVSRDGVSARLFVADERDAIQSHHKAGTFYENDILEAIAERFCNGGCFVDIGANVGNHLIYMAKRFPEANFIAFEPMKYQHSILVINMLLNNLEERIEIHKTAASDVIGMAQMVTPNLDNIGRSMITDAAYGEWVELAPIDQKLAGKNVSFIKIDVEGHEMSTLAGLTETVSRCRPTMLVEVNEKNRIVFTNWINQYNYRIDLEFKHYAENFEALIVAA